ncbi:MBL fold metallo-hydrolase [Undibacterium sp. TJN19]|uniref:MBL fold metallo-hydrolase n=1 Tax=Undibacterium sp. TJN19 TaxID=3413055 RepID=UPI003BEFD7F5
MTPSAIRKLIKPRALKCASRSASRSVSTFLFTSACTFTFCIAWAFSSAAQADSISDSSAVLLQMQGTRLVSHQAYTPTLATQEIKLTQNALLRKDRHFRLVTESFWPGQIKFHFMSTGSAEGMATVDLMQWRGGIEIEREDAASALTNYADLLFLSPALLLEQATERQPISTTAATSTDANYRIESFKDAAGRPATLALDLASGHVVSARNAVSRFDYSRYQDDDYFKQPQQVRVMKGDDLQVQWTVLAQAVPHTGAQDFALPPAYVEKQDKGALRASLIAPGTYRVDGTESGYHTGFSVGSHSVAIYDAPVSPAEAAKLRALIEQTAPGRKLAYVIVSHAHRDHIAGLPAYLNDGLHIMLGKDGKLAVARQLGDAVAAKTIEVNQATELDLGGRRIQLLPVASTHASDMLVAYDTASGTIFQGDLFYLPELGPVPPAFEGSEELDSLIRQHQLAVKLIVGVHGKTGDLSDLQKSLQLRKEKQERQERQEKM